MAIQNVANLYPSLLDDITLASGKSLWMNGGISNYLQTVQDGFGGRITHKWNSTRGTSETFLNSGDPAMRLFLGGTSLDGNYFDLQRSTAAGTAGASITWQSLLTVSGLNLSYKGNVIYHAGNDGSGSGLDADTVDGLDGSALVQVAGTQTITGTKTFNAARTAESVTWSAAPAAQQILSYETVRSLVLAASYTNSVAGAAASNNAYNGATGFTTTESFNPYSICSIGNSANFRIDVSLTGIWLVRFHCNVARTNPDLISLVGTGLRVTASGVSTDYTRLVFSASGNTVINTQAIYEKMFSLTAGDQVRPLFRVQSQNSTDVSISNVEMFLQYLGR